MSTIAVYAGSFDPITNGHVDIVRRSLQVFDQVIVAVAFNPNKDSAWFTPQERVAMIRQTFLPEGGRVIAGHAHGRRLRVPRDRGTRPTSGLVRGALFDMLEQHGWLDDAVVLDLFAGSGALGIGRGLRTEGGA